MNTLINCYFCNIALYEAKDWKLRKVVQRALRKVDQMYLESFEMWCFRKTEKMVSNGRVGNEEVLHSIKGRGITHMQ